MAAALAVGMADSMSGRGFGRSTFGPASATITAKRTGAAGANPAGRGRGRKAPGVASFSVVPVVTAGKSATVGRGRGRSVPGSAVFSVVIVVTGGKAA